ncbi:tyrosine--tRNA ligase, partial [bacterium]|nr:tyrosine--tRNA ligase [bacterium]
IEALRRSVVEVIPEPSFDHIVCAEKSLKIKFGADPSAPDLHLGHAVVLKVLRRLQDLGHTVQFLIGDYTAMIGDPTGKSETRPILTVDQVAKNAITYQSQVMKILRQDRTDVVFNSHWLDTMTSRDMIQLAAKYTVARMMERDDFQKRFSSNVAISIHEFLYPLLQGHDSVVLRSDVEIGGTDQKFNLLMGRHLQRESGVAQQSVMMVPILEGLDGVNKMSKSLGNHIAILDSPDTMYGKLLSIPDELITRYYTLLTDVADAEIKVIDEQIRSGAINPKTLKEAMAVRIVTDFHSEEAALGARDEFNRIFSRGEVPTEMPALQIKSGQRLADVLMAEGAVPSKKEFVRLVQQGAVSIDGTVLGDAFAVVPGTDGAVIRVGKRRFYKTVLAE